MSAAIELRGIAGEMDLPKVPELSGTRLAETKKDLAALGLVERERFDERRVAPEHPEHVAAHGGVHVHPRRNDDGRGALAQRLDHRHRRAHAETPRLVARRADDLPRPGAADDHEAHRLEAQDLPDHPRRPTPDGTPVRSTAGIPK